MNIDPSKSADQNILDLITSENPEHVFTLDKVDVGEVSAATGVDYNSVVTVTAKPNAGFSGSKDVYFTRVTPAQASAILAHPVRFEPGDTVSVMKQRICNLLGLIPEEVVFGTNDVFDLPSQAAVDVPVDVSPKNGSKVYIGSPLSVTMRLGTYEIQDLPSILSGTGWSFDSNRGWYNDDNTGANGVRTEQEITGLPSGLLGKVKSFEGVFTCYYNSPSGSLGGASIAFNTDQRTRDLNGTTMTIGLRDNWTIGTEGLNIYEQTGITRSYVNVIDRHIVFDFNEGETLTNVFVQGQYLSGYTKSLRGMKSLKMKLRTVG